MEHFARYAQACYGWPLFVYTDPGKMRTRSISPLHHGICNGAQSCILFLPVVSLSLSLSLSPSLSLSKLSEHFARYAQACYGWPLFVYTDPGKMHIRYMQRSVSFPKFMCLRVRARITSDPCTISLLITHRRPLVSSLSAHSSELQEAWVR